MDISEISQRKQMTSFYEIVETDITGNKHLEIIFREIKLNYDLFINESETTSLSYLQSSLMSSAKSRMAYVRVGMSITSYGRERKQY